jgi:HemY protein
MLFLLLFIVALAVIAFALEWVIDHPGKVTIEWGDMPPIETSLAISAAAILTAIAAAIVLWMIVTALLRSPVRWRSSSAGRRREKGFQALSRGIIAVGAGDAASARRAAQDAEKYLTDEPLTQFLKAQAAQLGGDRAKAEAAFHEMTLKPETRLLGLRGLHIEARRREDFEAAHHFAKTAHEIAPLPWAGGAMLEHHAAQGDWEQARSLVEDNLKSKSIDMNTAQKLRAVIETALATEKQFEHPHDALHLARQALKRRPGFTPAAIVAARVLTRHGDKRSATKLIESVWALSPHPDLAEAYLQAAPGESNTQFLARAAKLAKAAPDAPESRQMLAQAALAARDFARARDALAPLVKEGQKPTAHTCLLMAEIEDAENGPSGPVREWLARGSRAPRDPAWVADGVVSKSWAPASPKTGKLDAFEWKAPPDHSEHPTTDARANIPAAFITRAPEALTVASNPDVKSE